jgi:hypothetical protein
MSNLYKEPSIDDSYQVGVCSQYTVHVVTIYGIDAVANEKNVVLKFFDLVMKIQDFILQKQNKVTIN